MAQRRRAAIGPMSCVSAQRGDIAETRGGKPGGLGALSNRLTWPSLRRLGVGVAGVGVGMGGGVVQAGVTLILFAKCSVTPAVSSHSFSLCQENPPPRPERMLVLLCVNDFSPVCFSGADHIGGRQTEMGRYKLYSTNA